MTDPEIIKEIEKAAGLFNEGTYTPSELVSHLWAIIRDEKADLEKQVIHQRKVVEKLLHYVEEMRETEKLVKRGRRKLISSVNGQKKNIDVIILHLHNAGYNTDRFKNKTEQQLIEFNG